MYIYTPTQNMLVGGCSGQTGLRGKGWSPDGCLSVSPGWVGMRSDGCEMVPSLSLSDPGSCSVQPANTVALSFRFSKSLSIKGLIITELRMRECCRNSDGITDDIHPNIFDYNDVKGTRGFRWAL